MSELAVPRRFRGLSVASTLALVFALATFAPVAQPTRAETPHVQSARFGVIGPDGVNQAAVGIWPRERKPSYRYPIVIAFHGMTESKAGPQRGFLAWPSDYGLLEAYEALLAPPLTKRVFGGLVRDSELSQLNAELAARPMTGVFVVGVYTPDLLVDEGREQKVATYADWVANVLVPRVRDVFPVTSETPRAVGVDGVSLGGMVALEVGVRHPEVFGAIGTMQPAIRGGEAALAARLSEAAKRFPLKLRLLSSDQDPLLPVTRTLSSELRKRQVAHSLVVTPGGHDYAFNRGPGAVELLRFHDRALSP